MCETIRVLVVDDHPVVREGLCALIAAAPGMALAGAAADGEEAVRLAGALAPDVVVMDLMLPRLGGIAAIGAIKAYRPETQVLVFSGYADDDKVLGAVKVGALGYLIKDAAPGDVLRAIREVARGEASLHPAVARRLIREINHAPGLPPAEEQLT